MRTFLIFILILLRMTALGQIKTTNYQREVRVFLTDILHDSTHYTYADFQRDSIAAMSSNNGKTSSWHHKLDTIDYKYNIYTKHSRYHFNKIVVLENVIEASSPSHFFFEESDSSEIAQLETFLKEIDSNRIKEINRMFNKWTKDYLDEVFTTQKILKKLFDKDTQEGWKKYRKKYGAPYFQFSIPVFNSTYDIAYFSWSKICGSLCGVGYSCFYKRINGKWTLILMRKDWVS